PRMWTHARPQKEEIAIANNILNNFYEMLLTTIAQTRNIDKNVLKAVFDRGEINADEAKTLGLIDELVAANEATKDLREAKQTKFIENYEKISSKRDSWQVRKKIVVIPIANTIVDGRMEASLLSSFFPATGAKDVIDEITAAQDDDDVLGIIV